MDIDVSGLVVEAQPVARACAEIYLRHVGAWFVGLLAHGSAVKGGFIPGCSDLDMQLYLDDAAYSWHGQLPLEIGFAVRRELEAVDLGPFRYVQCYPRRVHVEPGWVGPIPGAYHLIAGRLPIPAATAADLLESARRALDTLDPAPRHLMGKLLGHGSERLARSLRLLCTEVWPAVYQVLALHECEPLATWQLNKVEAIRRLPAGVRPAAERFYAAVRAYYPAEDSLEGALDLISAGVYTLESATPWWARISATEAKLAMQAACSGELSP
ncbi:MAG TPA: hypothetical protein VLC95_13615 [Anaerolineae bacterium]|nr:hypothetical protein [Anaerolineae bacterium]